MKIHHIRNATFVIESNDTFILVDPMLGEKASNPPLAFFRFKPLKNPLVDLPTNTSELLKKVTHCLITHLHADHLDTDGITFLKENNIPVVCSYLDFTKLEKKGLNIQKVLKYDSPEAYLGGKIVGIKAIHGYGFIKKIAGNVMGFYLELPDDKSIYISSDTVYTTEVDRTLQSYKPDITVLAAGVAQLDIGKPVLMHQQDILTFVKNSPGKVYANHMEALNHCPNRRNHLKALLTSNKLIEKVDIPEDGKTLLY